MMKKTLSIIISIMLLCSLFTGCEKKPTVSVGAEGRYLLNLSKELDNDQIQLNCLPWFSTPEDAMEVFGLDLNEVPMDSGTLPGGRPEPRQYVRMRLPVWLEDMELPADMSLFFRWDYPVPWEDEPLRIALTSINFTTYFVDYEPEEEAYLEKLQVLLDTLKENQPEVYNQKLEAVPRVIYSYRETVIGTDGEPELSPISHSINVNQCAVLLSKKKAHAGLVLIFDVNQRNPDFEFGSEDNWDRWL